MKFIKLLWAAPCSVVGLVFAAIVLMMGGRAVLNRGALEVTYRPARARCGPRALALPFRGIVFGHIILAVTAEELASIGPHERVHVEQYERWGIFFFVAYALSSLWHWLRGRDAYWHNHFEVQARKRSGDVRQ